MSEPTHQSQKGQFAESAFGRPASWWTAWPALAVGLTAFLLAVYGTFWLPRRLPTQYTQALQRSQQLYQQLAEKTSGSGSERLVDAAGDMDVIYSRLVGLEGNSPERYWQWAEFQQSHADLLKRILHDPAVSLSPSVRQRWKEQAEHFRNKSHEILDQLSLRPSELQAKSALQVAQRKYRTGLGEFGVREAGVLADSLARLVAVESTASGQTGSAGTSDTLGRSEHSLARQPTELTRQEIQAARLLLVQLQIEAAWQSRAGSSLTSDPKRLEIAWALLEEFYPPQTNHSQHSQPQSGGAEQLAGQAVGHGSNLGHTRQADEMQWQATRGLLAAMTGRKLEGTGAGDVQASGSVAKAHLPADPQQSWNDELAVLQLAALNGDWQQVASQLGMRAGQLEPAVTSGLARTVCRLLVSPGTSGAEQAELGVLLAAQLAPHLPETGELLWQCARSQAGQGSEPVLVPDSLAQTIMAGQSGWLKHSLAALSATLEDKPTVAHTHLQLLSRTQSNAALVARVVLWRSQSLDSDTPAPAEAAQDKLAREESRLRELGQLSELMRAVVKLEPKAGLNWFVLGTLQFRAGNFEDMQLSLVEAQELLGEVPAIAQMLDAAGR